MDEKRHSDLSTLKDILIKIRGTSDTIDKYISAIDRIINKVSDNRFYICVIGTTARGKSALINLALGAPTSEPQTVIPTYISFGSELSLKIVHFDGSELTSDTHLIEIARRYSPPVYDSISPIIRLSYFLLQYIPKSTKERILKELVRTVPSFTTGASTIEHIEVTLPHTTLPDKVVLVDTPGLVGDDTALDKRHVDTLRDIADCIILVGDDEETTAHAAHTLRQAPYGVEPRFIYSFVMHNDGAGVKLLDTDDGELLTVDLPSWLQSVVIEAHEAIKHKYQWMLNGICDSMRIGLNHMRDTRQEKLSEIEHDKPPTLNEFLSTRIKGLDDVVRIHATQQPIARTCRAQQQIVTASVNSLIDVASQHKHPKRQVQTVLASDIMISEVKTASNMCFEAFAQCYNQLIDAYVSAVNSIIDDITPTYGIDINARKVMASQADEAWRIDEPIKADASDITTNIFMRAVTPLPEIQKEMKSAADGYIRRYFSNISYQYTKIYNKTSTQLKKHIAQLSDTISSKYGNTAHRRIVNAEFQRSQLAQQICLLDSAITIVNNLSVERV